MKTILEIKNICKTYQSKEGEILALDNIHFRVKEGEFVSIKAYPGGNPNKSRKEEEITH